MSLSFNPSFAKMLLYLFFHMLKRKAGRRGEGMVRSEKGEKEAWAVSFTYGFTPQFSQKFVSAGLGWVKPWARNPMWTSHVGCIKAILSAASLGVLAWSWLTGAVGWIWTWGFIPVLPHNGKSVSTQNTHPWGTQSNHVEVTALGKIILFIYLFLPVQNSWWR